MRRLATLAALAALLTGCVDFRDPLTPWKPGQGAQAHFFFQLVQPAAAPAMLTLSGQVMPGTDEDGYIHPLVRESVDALGTAVQPAQVELNGTRRYSHAWRIPADSVPETAIVVDAPPIEGIAAVTPGLRWHSVAREGPGVLTIKEGEPLLLRIRGYDRALTPAPTFQRWTVDLYGPRGSFNLGSNGVPSQVTRVPADWLPARAGETVSVNMTLTRQTSFNTPPGDYTGMGFLSTTMQWIVRIEAP